MSSYSEGQTHQLAEVLEKAGYTPADVTLLGQNQWLLEKVRELWVTGDLVITPRKWEVYCTITVGNFKDSGRLLSATCAEVMSGKTTEVNAVCVERMTERAAEELEGCQFPVSPQRAEVDLVKTSPRDLGFYAKETSRREIHARIRGLGLQVCPDEVIFEFMRQKLVTECLFIDPESFKFKDGEYVCWFHVYPRKGYNGYNRTSCDGHFPSVTHGIDEQLIFVLPRK